MYLSFDNILQELGGTRDGSREKSGEVESEEWRKFERPIMNAGNRCPPDKPLPTGNRKLREVKCKK